MKKIAVITGASGGMGREFIRTVNEFWTPPDEVWVIARRAWSDLRREKDAARYGFIARGQAILCKAIPHSLIMNIWQGQQDLH